ncbi:MAG: hypothetical protein HY437_02190 [Candidatus Magasanikbacteria bacterium]|nr:hypothetical protein [Candidatus Magasanikbacteria bacterium]
MIESVMVTKHSEEHKETALAVLLRGTRFRSEVAEYAAAHGVNKDEAEKTVFVQRIQALRKEIRYEGFFSQKLEHMPRFEGALKEVLDEKERQRMIADAGDATVCRSLTLPELTPKEYQSMKKRMSGASHHVILDAAENARMIPALLERFAQDPRLAAPENLRALLATHRDLSADLGRALLAMDTIMRHEMNADAQLNFERTMKEALETTAQSIADFFWRAPRDWFVAVKKSGSASALETAGGVFIETGKFIGREVRAVLRITGAGLKGLMVYLAKSVVEGEQKQKGKGGGKKEKKEK